jgi:prepilin peptidase CpaA
MTLSSVESGLWAVALAALLASAYTDIKDRIIPNELAGLVAATALALSFVARPEQVWIGLLAAISVLLALGCLAHFGFIGGGDVKLISAAALLVPPSQIGELLLSIVLAGGALSCVYLIAHHVLKSRYAVDSVPSGGGPKIGGPSPGLLSSECARIAAGGPVPYAVAILIGVAGFLARGLA